ncbi:hypothetical protein [Prosthecobacter sp.]|uniref:hypothetical protein n=1 Tax=Prosthecobacter sp. TaxID=1965333 RepID=UPI0037831E04
MLFQQPAAIGRVIGLALCVISTWISGKETLEILGKAMHRSLWKITADFGFLALIAFSLTILGEWLWSFEEGWERLQRGLRILQAGILVGGFALALIMCVEHAFKVI